MTCRKMQMPGSIKADIALGELIDKITILEIKDERIFDTHKRKNVRFELAKLVALLGQSCDANPKIDECRAKLRAVNAEIWDLEDSIRDHERRKDFGASFIDVARRVYKTNDRRAALKREINLIGGSEIVEEKSYAEY